MIELEPRRGEVAGRTPGLPPAVSGILALGVSLRRGVLKLAVAAALAGAAIAFALLRHGLPDGAGAQVLTVIALVAAAAPPIVLGSFWIALGELLELPERIRLLPADARSHGEELRRLADEARRQRGRRLTAPRQVWRLVRLTASSRELLTPYAPVLPLLSLPFLGAVALAAVAAVLELVVAAVVLLVLLVT